jgi:hypothetical protein
MSRLLTLILLLALVAASLPALAGERARARLEYVLGPGAERCPDRSALMGAIVARLGYEPWDEQAPRLFKAIVRREGKILRAEVEIRDGDRVVGRRELSSAENDCQELAAAVGLAISIAIDPLSVGRKPPAAPPASAPAPREPPPPATDHEPPVPAVVAPVRPRPETARLRVSAGLGGLVAVGSAPGVAGGLTLQARLRLEALSVGLEGRVDLPARTDSQGGEVGTTLVAGALLPCVHWRYLAGCGNLTAGAIRAAGYGWERSDSGSAPYLAAGARGVLELPLVSVLSLRLHADLLAHVVRVRLQDPVTGDSFWSTPPVCGTFGLGVAARLR